MYRWWDGGGSGKNRVSVQKATKALRGHKDPGEDNKDQDSDHYLVCFIF